MEDDWDRVHRNKELSETEKEQLIQVMKRAKKNKPKLKHVKPMPVRNEEEFEIAEEKNLLRQPLEGQLLKFTNVVKGFQYRWFALNPDLGVLEYYEKEEHRSQQRARGLLPLSCAVISPSDEDSQTFLVNSVNGEVYKLKAFDAKERQHWVSRLRAVAELHTDNYIAQVKLSVPGSTGHSPPAPASLSSTASFTRHHSNQQTPERSRKKQQQQQQFDNISQSSIKSFAGPPELQKNVRDVLSELQHEQVALAGLIESFNSTAALPPLDKDLLLVKATSLSAVTCLEQCLDILKEHQSMMNGLMSGNQLQQRHRFGSEPSLTLDESLAFGGNSMRDSFKPSSPQRRGSSASGSAHLGIQGANPIASASSNAVNLTVTGPMPPSIAEGVPLPQLCPIPEMEEPPPSCVAHEEDVLDGPAQEEEDLGSVEDHKSVILHLLSQLKLGMDLTRVVLPTFILEKRSLLEMFADCMAHPQLFLRIPEMSDPESRMMSVLEWYLTSFPAGRKGSLAKKPFNPVIGETFHCSWPLSSVAAAAAGGDAGEQLCGDGRLVYTAEQVSHHPPVTAFYFECPEKQISLNASIYTKSKFMGMSIGVSMLGNLRLNVISHGEEYVFSLPSAYARSILTVPWVELGDKITVNCPQTKYSASVTFHTKPFYGGKLHRVSAEVKNSAAAVVCKVQGEWNGQMEFEYTKGDKKLVDVSSLPIMKKNVRPVGQQRAYESRKLWLGVCQALRANDIQLATEQKHALEERQRQSEKYRRERGLGFPVKFFRRSDVDPEAWTFRTPLQAGQTTTSA